MSAEKIVKNCAPTLAGIKTANLFNEYFTDKEKLFTDIRNFNLINKSSGIKMLLISITVNRALIYVYRLSDLRKDLKNRLSRNILDELGYDANDVYGSISKLSNRISSNSDFPHEIGLFLGYPPEDVKGFIDNKGANYKTFGVWKVYGDENKALQTFKKYQICRETFLDRLQRGYSLSQLIIQK